jgi:hypothetical protein
MLTSDEVNVLDYGRGASMRRRGTSRTFMLICQALLIVGGLSTFWRSLALPAWRDLTGLQCLIVGFPFWPSNSLLLLSPVAAFALSFTYIRPPYVVLAIFFLVSDGWVVWGTSREFPHLHSPGYSLWLCSHALVTAGLLIPTWAVHPRRNLPQRACRSGTNRS